MIGTANRGGAADLRQRSQWQAPAESYFAWLSSRHQVAADLLDHQHKARSILKQPDQGPAGELIDHDHETCLVVKHTERALGAAWTALTERGSWRESWTGARIDAVYNHLHLVDGELVRAEPSTQLAPVIHELS